MESLAQSALTPHLRTPPLVQRLARSVTLEVQRGHFTGKVVPPLECHSQSHPESDPAFAYQPQ